MAKFIPNANTWIGYIDTLTNLADGVDGLIPAVADITGSTDLTGLTISITASAQGNTVPTPALNSLFETSIPGSNQASFSGDFYRDDPDDDAWTTLPRGTEGFIIISRNDPAPTTGDWVEVWPVVVTSRTASQLTSNTAQSFTVTCSIPRIPNEGCQITAV